MVYFEFLSFLFLTFSLCLLVKVLPLLVRLLGGEEAHLKSELLTQASQTGSPLRVLALCSLSASH